ncbi:MAG TPA: hypothetical protein VMR98_06040 [Candidatus Polarisedimenticolaceae bacterium]|nr:hypothetical protein [Candidatus Polarisedimenticolaceae bacterium]
MAQAAPSEAPDIRRHYEEVKRVMKALLYLEGINVRRMAVDHLEARCRVRGEYVTAWAQLQTIIRNLAEELVRAYPNVNSLNPRRLDFDNILGKSEPSSEDAGVIADKFFEFLDQVLELSLEGVTP